MRVQETPQLAKERLVWVPWHDLPVPGPILEVVGTTLVSHSRSVVVPEVIPGDPVVAQPPVPAGAPSVLHAPIGAWDLLIWSCLEYMRALCPFFPHHYVSLEPLLDHMVRFPSMGRLRKWYAGFCSLKFV